MKTCPSDIELVKHSEGKLLADEKVRVEQHLLHCSSCRSAFEQHLQNQELFTDLVTVWESNHWDTDWSLSRSQSEDQFRQSIQTRGYEILKEIHRGGQGIVYAAIQLANDRKVAVKRLELRDYSVAEQVARFEREIDLVTKLAHPNIVTVFDNGMINECPYLVMEFVNGLPLHRFVQQNFALTGENKMAAESFTKLLSLFLRVCKAISFAHRHGVIHRDLKPNNILVDQLGEPKILDFGLAKLIDESVRELTQTGQFLGTLAYASPEQVRFGSVKDMDTRTDVYSLGVILFELVTSALPYGVDEGLSSTIKNITEKPPRQPSQLNRSVDDDVETIVLTALAKAPDRRYQSVEQMSSDIERYLRGLPIEAKRDHHFYVLYKSLARFKWYVFSLATLVATIVAGLVVSLWFWSQAVEQTVIANVAKDNETEARIQAELQSYIANIVAAKVAVRNNDVAEAKRRLEAAPESYRGWEWEHFRQQSDQSQQTIVVHELYIVDFEYLPEPNQIISIAGDNSVKLWNLADSSVEHERELEFPPIDLAVLEPGAVVAVATNQKIYLLDGRTLKTIQSLLSSHPLIQAEFLNRNELCILKRRTQDQTELVVWNWRDQTERVIEVPINNITSFSVDRMKRQLAVAGSEAGVFYLDESKFQNVEISEFTVGSHFLNQIQQVAWVNTANEVILVDREDLAVNSRLVGHTQVPNDVIVLDPSTIATGATDRTIRLWDSESGRTKKVLRGHDQSVVGLKRITKTQMVSGSQDSTIRKWDRRVAVQPRIWSGHDQAVRDFDFDESKQWVASCGEDGRVILRDLGSGKLLRVLEHDQSVFSLSISASTRQLAVGGDEPFIRVWDLRNGTYEKLVGHEDRVHAVDYSEDGRLLVSGSRDKTVRVWDIETMQCIKIFKEHDDCVHASVWRPGYSQVASRSHQDIRLWNIDATTDTLIFSHRISPEDYSLSFDSRGRYLAAGSSIAGFGRGYSKVFDLLGDTDRPATLERHNTPVNAFAFFPTGQKAVSASNESLKLWDLRFSVELASLDLNSRVPYSLAVSPSGTSVLAGMKNGEVWVWDSE